MPQQDPTKLYNVTLVNPTSDERTTIEVAANEYILDAASKYNIKLPSACNAGACIVCAGKLLEGKVDQDDRCFLKERELKAGFILTCRAYPLSNCVILTHQEDELLSTY